MFDLGNANAGQRKAILTTEGPLLVIAGPGTGKTFTIVKRIAYLIAERNVRPDEIMAATFTEKAAKELLTRISNEFVSRDIDINLNEMYIGTFHSLCLRLLKEFSEDTGTRRDKRILDAFEQTYLVCRNIENFRHLRGFTDHIPTGMGVWKQSLEICRYVNRVMEESADRDRMANDRDEDIRFLSKLTERYLELLERNRCMDFSSIQTETYRLLADHPDILSRVRNRIRYIMADEYQDTNSIQESLVFLIAGEWKNICVVGDDDQGIYRFRGAVIRNILEFPDQFARGECCIVHLNQNYRSLPGIVEFCGSWMDDADGTNPFHWGRYRHEKKIAAARERAGAGMSVFRCGGSPEAEKEDLLALVQRLRQSGTISDYNQIVFLFHSVKSREAAGIGGYLEANGIPVYSPRSGLFFKRTEVRQILGCLMACFPSYLADLKGNSFANRIPEELREYYIGCVKEARTLMKADGALYAFIDGQMKYVATLQEDTDQGLLDLLYHLLAFEPFRGYLKADPGGPVWKSRAARNLAEISRMLKKYSFLHNMHGLSGRNKAAMPEELFNIYIRYLYIDGIGEYEDEEDYAPSGCVSFLTIHQSKGLEFPAVVVGSLGSVPRRDSNPLLYLAESRFFHRKPFEPVSDIKYFDFWRLYYVAFSRAQDMLVLATGNEASKYFAGHLARLPDISDFAPGTGFEAVKKRSLKRIYSFTSHISVYDGCPTQYKFYKEYGFAQNQMFHTSVGSLVHATLEDLNKCILSGNRARVNEERIREWFYINYQNMREQTGYYLTGAQQEKALGQVLRYCQNRGAELGRVWKAEEEIRLVLPGYILQGVVDLVECGEDAVEIVDYKTGPKPDADNHPERVEHYKKQLEIYAYLIEKRYGKRSAGCIFTIQTSWTAIP